MLEKIAGSWHNHTPLSDGLLGPLRLILLHRRYGFGEMVVTDHDFISLPDGSWQSGAVRLAGRLAGVRVISGAEFSCSLFVAELGLSKKKISPHIVGIGLGKPAAELREMAAALAAARERREAEVLERLRRLRPELCLPDRLEKRRGVLTSTDVALAVKKLNPALDLGPLLQSLIKDPAYLVPWEKANAEKMIAAIHASGGRAIWAHPGKTLKEDFDRFELVAEKLAGWELDGIEAFATGQDLAQTLRIIRCCRRQHLRIGGGADTHWEKQLADYAAMLQDYARQAELKHELESEGQL